MISRIEADSLVRDVNGNVIRRGYPAAYWDLQRDLDLLQTQRKTQTDHIADLRKQAEAAKAMAQKPPFAGRLSWVDQRGVPVVLPSTAATQPAVKFLPSTAPSTQDAATQADAGPATEPTSAPSASTMPATTRGLFD